MTHGNTIAPDSAPTAEDPGAAKPSTSLVAGTDTATSSSLERADVLTDQFTEKVSVVTAALGRTVLRFASRLREEAEDVWAEAQQLRRGNPS